MAYISSQHHSFDIRLAQMYGIECALLIHHFQHWIRLNRFKGKNIREGRCWTYQSRKEIQANFPYWSIDQIRRTCDRLVELGVLMKGNFNRSQVDRTIWYAFVNEADFGCSWQICQSTGNFAHPAGGIPKPIPDTITDTKTYKEEDPPNPQRGSVEGGAPPPKLEKHGKFVALEKEDHQKLCKEHGEGLINEMIEQMNDYVACTGKKYKDYAAALRQWLRKRKDKPSGFSGSRITPLSKHQGLNKDHTPRDPRKTLDLSNEIIDFSARNPKKTLDFSEEA